MLGPLVAEMQTPVEAGLEKLIKGLDSLGLRHLSDLQVEKWATQGRSSLVDRAHRRV